MEIIQEKRKICGTSGLSSSPNRSCPTTKRQHYMDNIAPTGLPQWFKPNTYLVNHMTKQPAAKSSTMSSTSASLRKLLPTETNSTTLACLQPETWEVGRQGSLRLYPDATNNNQCAKHNNMQSQATATEEMETTSHREQLQQQARIHNHGVLNCKHTHTHNT